MKSGRHSREISSRTSSSDSIDWFELAASWLLQTLWALGLLASLASFAVTQSLWFLALCIGFAWLIVTEFNS